MEYEYEHVFEEFLDDINQRNLAINNKIKKQLQTNNELDELWERWKLIKDKIIHLENTWNPTQGDLSDTEKHTFEELWTELEQERN